MRFALAPLHLASVTMGEGEGGGWVIKGILGLGKRKGKIGALMA